MKIRRFREVDIQHTPDIHETLSKIQKFLQDHETQSNNDVTHSVFDNFPDWWQGNKTNFKLAIAEDSTIDLLYKYISTVYDMNVPLTLAEKRTAEIRLVQDIEVWGTKNAALKAEDLFTTEKSFAKLLGQIMGELYPLTGKGKTPTEFLDAFIFDSSGQSRQKAIEKTSIRVVWPVLIVDKERACKIRDYLVHKFEKTQDQQLKDLHVKAMTDSKENGWNNIFNDGIYLSSKDVRMPLNDRCAPAPLKKLENRPLAPYGIMRYNYNDKAELTSIEMPLHRDKKTEGGWLSGEDWLKTCCLRVDGGTPLTEWKPPAWQGPTRPSRSTNGPRERGGGGGHKGGGEDWHANGGQSGGYRQSDRPTGAMRQSGAVRMPTRMGSDSGRKPRFKASMGARNMAEETNASVERRFEGTPQEFKSRLETYLGSGSTTQGTIQEDEHGVTWSQTTDAGVPSGAKIQFKALNKRVYISGKKHQLRGLLACVAPFVDQVAQDARSVQSSRVSGGSRPGSEIGGYAASGLGAPSAPSRIYAPTASNAGSNISRRSDRSGVAPWVSRKHRAIKEFKGEADGELDLTPGDIIIMTHDPEQASGLNIHRWVFGHMERDASKTGWFPRSWTEVVDEDAIAEEGENAEELEEAPATTAETE